MNKNIIIIGLLAVIAAATVYPQIKSVIPTKEDKFAYCGKLHPLKARADASSPNGLEYFRDDEAWSRCLAARRG